MPVVSNTATSFNLSSLLMEVPVLAPLLNLPYGIDFGSFRSSFT